MLADSPSAVVPARGAASGHSSPSPAAAAAAPPTGSVPLSQQVGFGLGSFLDMWGHWLYQSLAFHVFNVGLGVAPGLISTALGLKIFVDAVSDALFGWLSDNTRTRWGRRRPYILVGGVLSGIGLPLMFAVGRGWSDSEYFVFMLVSTCLYVPVMSCFNMPWNSLGAEMTPDYHERTRVMSVKNAIQKIPELAMFVAAQFTTLAIFNSADGKPDILLGAQVYTSILGAIMVLVSVAIFALTRERYYEAVVARSTQRVPFKDTLYRTLKNRPFRQMLGTMLAYNMATAMVGLLGYYATVYYVCGGNVVEATKWNSLMGVAGLVCGLLGISFAGAVARRYGKRNTLMTVLVLGIFAFIGDWFFYNPQLPWLQLFASGGVAFIGAGFWTIYGSAMADVIDHDELDSGQRREGSFAACGSWISKVGLALGNSASGWVLMFTGFDAKLPAQSEEAIFLIRVFLSGIPIVGLAVALFVVSRYFLTEQRMHEIRAELEARRGSV
ncbi:MFS transporter [Roseateles sp. BYS87W]|uniref:MFS transporter n=1 Tax=Pelomonas baiyunensis TaxID=3299026 RepID=A0ABW7H3V5_9BURK